MVEKEGTRFKHDDIRINNKQKSNKNIKYLSDALTKKKIMDQIGAEITVGNMTWMHVDKHDQVYYKPDYFDDSSISSDNSNNSIHEHNDNIQGFKNVDCTDEGFDQEEFFRMFWPGNVEEQLEKINNEICENNKKKRKTRYNYRKVQYVDIAEFMTFLGIIILASVIYGEGRMMWEPNEESVIPRPLISKYMTNRRFKEIRAFVSFLMSCPEHKDVDPWWRVSTFVDDFNRKRFQHVAAGKWKVLDESMFSFRPRSSPTGGLPTLVYIFRKPEPFGIEIKCVCDAETGIMIGMEIQRGKMLMKEVSSVFLLYFVIY